MGPLASQLLQAIEQHRLYDREPLWATIRVQLRRGKFSEARAKALQVRCDQVIDYYRLHTNCLMRPPTEEELHDQGPPDVEIGTLVENDLRLGLNFSDRPRHMLITGATGSGKTNALRIMIHRLDAWRKQ